MTDFFNGQKWEGTKCKGLFHCIRAEKSFLKSICMFRQLLEGEHVENFALVCEKKT